MDERTAEYNLKEGMLAGPQFDLQGDSRLGECWWKEILQCPELSSHMRYSRDMKILLATLTCHNETFLQPNT